MSLMKLKSPSGLGGKKMKNNKTLHGCILCGELTNTNLEFEDGSFICETCAQIQGELAEM